jgi:hypothetical protein
VAWHEGAGWVGWAPLPWQVGWRVGVGLDWGGVNVNVALGPSAWYFVQSRDMVSPGLRYRVAPASRNVTLVQTTQNVTNYIYVDNRIIDRSVKVEKIGRAVGHTIPCYRVRPADSPGSDPGGKVRGQEFVLFRPNPVRGARSQGRVVPPGHDAGREPVDRGRHAGRSDEVSESEPGDAPQEPVDRGRHAGRSDEASNLDSGEESATDSDSTHPSTQTKQRPSRYPKAAEPQNKRAQQQPPAEATPRSEDSPEQEAPLATPVGNRSNRRSPADRSGNAAPPGQTKPDNPGSVNRGNADTPAGKPESANAPAEKPDQPKTQTPKPEQTRQQPGKSRGKKAGGSAAKPDKPKPDEKDPKGANSEESKSDNADSGDKN